MSISENAIKVDNQPMSAPAVSAGLSFAALVGLHSLLDCFAGVFPIFKHMTGMSLGMAGAMASVAVIISWATQPFFGIWADRGYMRTHILLGTAMTFPMMLLGLIGNSRESLGVFGTVLIFACIFSGRMGQAIYHPAAAAMAGNLAPTRRSTMLGLFIAFGWAGYGVSQWLFSSVHRATGGHTEWLLLPGALLLALGAIYCRPNEINTPTTERPKFLALVGGLLGDRSGLLSLFLSLAFMSALGQGFLFLLPEFTEARGYPQWLIYGGALMCYVAGSASAMIPAGYLADRAGRKTVMVGSLVLSLGVYITLIAMPSLPLPAFAALLFMTGGLMNIANPVGVAIGQHLAPENRSLVTGILMGLAWALGGIAPLATGALAQQAGPILALGSLAVFNLIAIPLAMAVPNRG